MGYVIGIIIGVLGGLYVIIRLVRAIVKLVYITIKHPGCWSESSCHVTVHEEKSIAEQVRDGIALSDIEHGRNPGNWGTSHYYK